MATASGGSRQHGRIGGGVLPYLHGHDERWIPAKRAAPPLPKSSGDGTAPSFPRQPAGGAAGVRPGLLHGSDGAVAAIAAGVVVGFFYLFQSFFAVCQFDTR